MKETFMGIQMYDNPFETVVKELILCASWFVGVLIVGTGKTTSIDFASYFVFALSLLMEIMPRLVQKKGFWRIVYGISMFFIIIVVLLSFGGLIAFDKFNKCGKVIHFLCVPIMILIMGDLIVTLISVEELDNTNNSQGPSVGADSVAAFNKNLCSGNLGTVSEGEKNE